MQNSIIIKNLSKEFTGFFWSNRAVVSANCLKIDIINKIASSLKITKLSLDKISECNQGPDILRLWVIPLSLPGGDKNKRKYVGTIWKAFVREPGGWLAWIMAKEGRRKKRDGYLFSFWHSESRDRNNPRRSTDKRVISIPGPVEQFQSWLGQAIKCSRKYMPTARSKYVAMKMWLDI